MPQVAEVEQLAKAAEALEALDTAYVGLCKAKYSAEQLQALKEKGHTYPGTTSYPIDDEEDLDNAIHAVGRGKVAGHDAIRAYVIRRAKEMGRAGKIPENWGTKGELQKSDVTVDAVAIWKAEDGSHMVYGVVLEPGLRDSQGDVVGETEIQKAAHDYLRASRAVDTDHSGVDVQGVSLVESAIMPQDMTWHGKPVVKGSWVVGYSVDAVENPEVWARISDPVHPRPLTGLSMEGSAVRLGD